MSIEICDVTKTFHTFTALRDITLHVRSGELVALLGPSGCGKTTLLRILAGLERPDRGAILLNGDDVTDRHIGERGVGFVFQHYALFRHMTVFENIAFGLRVRPRATRPSNKTIDAKVRQLLKLVQLEWLGDRYPRQLSGGQRQRVALARALAVEPAVLLLDEPFGALDAKVRKELRRWLRRLHDELHVTSVFVTHDQDEALEVADRVVVMNAGRVEQIGTPEDVYERPASPFVYDFLGDGVNLFHGRVHEGRVTIGDLEVALREHNGISDGPTVGYVRPHEIDLDRRPDAAGAIEATVRRIQAVGAVARVEITRTDNGDILEGELSQERWRELALHPGERVFVRPKTVRVFPEPVE
jgi:sulfate transport system ATP-binding protein